MPTVVHAVSPPVGRSHKGRGKQSLLGVADATQRKANGIHYTPPLLAAYLAQQVVAVLANRLCKNGHLFILDPACGDGELLKAIADAVPRGLGARLALTGFDTLRLPFSRQCSLR